jgi:Translation elongation factor P (EF-P)/translation initiation factor 5A (eIF-5A)
MVDHSLLRNGNKVLVDNQPYVIMDTDFVNPGKGQAFTKIKIKNLLNKKTIEKTVKIGEELNEADVLNTSMQFLYQESNTYPPPPRYSRYLRKPGIDRVKKTTIKTALR